MISLLTSLTAASPDSTGPSCVTGGVDTTGATLIVIGIAGFKYTERYAGGGVVPQDANDSGFSGGALLNTYTPLSIYEDATTVSGVNIWYVNNPVTSTTHFFRGGSGGTGIYPAMWVWVFSGTNTSGPFDTESGNTAATPVTTIQPSAAIGTSGEVLCCIVADNFDTGAVEAIDSSFVQSFTEFSGGNSTGQYPWVDGAHSSGGGAYKIVTGSEQPTWSGLNGALGGLDAVVAIASFKATATVETLTVQIQEQVTGSNLF
jgi:hypothetical protein